MRVVVWGGTRISSTIKCGYRGGSRRSSVPALRVVVHCTHPEVCNSSADKTNGISSSSGSPRAMAAWATAIEFLTELIDVVSDGLDLVPDPLDLLELFFELVYLLHDSPHPGDFVVRILHGVSGSAARISD